MLDYVAILVCPSNIGRQIVDVFQVDDGTIVDAQGQPVRLRGTCVGGWMNMENFADSSRHSHFWQHPLFQDRFAALWGELARRYEGNLAVAGYNVMNEPASGETHNRPGSGYTPDWETVNSRRKLAARSKTCCGVN
jgi:hypothetical protein